MMDKDYSTGGRVPNDLDDESDEAVYAATIKATTDRRWIQLGYHHEDVFEAISMGRIEVWVM
eukprot:CAMPEP_0204617892 /NCGR_PEP_ID=MMETSP0717-20131115/4733_1 /ASSEMBLY_ACC=CAM_ASM_000666 /TAXON_ID=230516 /ORGANISM="Chaetoceros curvisetus" /LENGTH=61 /DNA_ID=CAMNT_0051631529 /DNA_START=371 /DNA_END=557 /DNA_ORIENTATION=-